MFWQPGSIMSYQIKPSPGQHTLLAGQLPLPNLSEPSYKSSPGSQADEQHIPQGSPSSQHSFPEVQAPLLCWAAGQEPFKIQL